MKGAIALLVGAFLVFYIITQPNHAADIAGGAWGAVVSVAHGVGNFVDKLAS